MNRLKDLILRVLGDQGADTLKRYFAQIIYSAYWCIRMLHSSEGIDAVIPEAGEDLLLVRRGIHELHQIKTRDESRGPWTIKDVLPILCQQYHRGSYLSDNCHFHFVSNQIAENKAQRSLYRLKHLLEIKHSGTISLGEQDELRGFEVSLVPKIQEIMRNEYNYNVESATAISLLHNTWIETECSMVCASDNINMVELDEALALIAPGAPSYNLVQLEDIHMRLIMLIVKKIINKVTVNERKIKYDDVINCRGRIVASDDKYPELDQVPGKTILDKKVYLGGFDPTEVPRFHKQKLLTESILRRYHDLGLEHELERLVSALLDHHGECRSTICRLDGLQKAPGPYILSMLRPKLTSLAGAYLPSIRDFDDQFCMGLLWKETDKCCAWWNSLQDTA